MEVTGKGGVKFEDLGFVGMHSINYVGGGRQMIIEEYDNHTNTGGWGCFIMLNKKDWIDIPDNIKIWYGDNFIKDVNPTPKACLRNFRVDTEMSTTSDEPIWDERKKEDYNQKKTIKSSGSNSGSNSGSSIFIIISSYRLQYI